jgi:Uri superfamily endonuclease
LFLWLDRAAVVSVGRLGKKELPAGKYAYLGSAMGPGGLRARLGRHLRGEGKPHWHIDALRRVALVQAVCYLTVPWVTVEQRLECLWGQALAGLPGAAVPIPGFGASDCRLGCPAHLVALPSADLPYGALVSAAHVPLDALICICNCEGHAL